MPKKKCNTCGKMNKVLILAVISLIALSVVGILAGPRTGQVIEVHTLDDVINNKDQIQEEYNANIEYVPGFIPTLLGSEVILITVTRYDGTTESMTLTTEDGRIISMEDAEEHTIIAYTTEAVFDAIIQADDQVAAFQMAMANGFIEYEAVGIKAKVKTGIGSIAIQIASWF